MSHQTGALRRVFTNNHNPEHKKEKAMKTKIFTLMAALMAVFAFTFTPSIALAQNPEDKPADDADKDKPADKKDEDEKKSDSPLMPVKSWEELSELDHYVGRHYYVTMQAEYVEKQLKPAVKTITPKNVSRFTNLFEGFQFVLNAPGDKVPAKTNKAMMDYLKANSCEKSDGKWSDGCYDLWKKVKAEADKALKDAPSNDFTANAKKMLSAAAEYAEYEGKPLKASSGDAVILAHGAIARATVQLPEGKRPYKGLTTGGLVGQNGCILMKDGTKHCGKIEKADASGITVNDGKESKTVTPEEIAKGDKAFVIGEAGSIDSVKGKDACFLRDKQEAKCGKVEKADANGVTLAGETVPWDKLQKGGDTVLAFGDIELIKPNWGKGKHTNDGIYVLGEVGMTSVLASDQSNLMLVNFGAGVGWTAPKVPFTLEFSLGGLVSPKGGIASHYSSLVEGGERWTMYFKGGAGFRPKFANWFGLNVMAYGLATINGGGGFQGALGPEFYLGPKHSWVLGANFLPGYFDSGKAWGSNPGIDTPDPRAEGGSLAGSLMLRKEF